MRGEFLAAQGRQRFVQAHVHHLPDGFFRRGPGIEMIVLGVLRRMIGIGLAHHFHHAHDGGVRTAVIEKAQIAFFHGLHEVAGLIVAHAVPGRGLPGCVLQILPGVAARLALEQPVVLLFYQDIFSKRKWQVSWKDTGPAGGGKTFLEKGHPLPLASPSSSKNFFSERYGKSPSLNGNSIILADKQQERT